MILHILLIIAGLALVVIGAELLVGGASSVARKAGISEFVIGLTIVAIGTSAPEMVVSFMGAIRGNADISIGNVFGSNIFNTLLILGISALLMPIPITKNNLKADIPMNIIATVLVLVLGLNATIFRTGSDVMTRTDGMILLAVFILYMIYSFKAGRKGGAGNEDAECSEDEKNYSTPVSILLIIIGLGALVFGGQLFVDSATDVAHRLGISDKFIAITILAGGTSMPELATCIVAAVKKKGQMALGNILGSNVFNLLLILGGSATISNLSFASIDYADVAVLLLSSVIVLTSAYVTKKDRIDRVDGTIMLLCEAAYMTWLFIKL